MSILRCIKLFDTPFVLQWEKCGCVCIYSRFKRENIYMYITTFCVFWKKMANYHDDHYLDNLLKVSGIALFLLRYTVSVK